MMMQTQQENKTRRSVFEKKSERLTHRDHQNRRMGRKTIENSVAFSIFLMLGDYDRGTG